MFDLHLNSTHERFERDPMFHAMVSYFEAMYYRGECSVDDIRQAATYAAIRFEMHRGFPGISEAALEQFRKEFKASGHQEPLEDQSEAEDGD